MPRSPNEPLQILLVEDNPAEVRMAQEALRLAGFLYRLWVVMDGQAALAFLRREGDFTESPVPDLVLLDLKLPRLSGIGVLAVMRAQERAERPVVSVFTGSNLPDDRARADALEADLFVTKPIGVDAYVARMKQFRDLALAR